MKGTLKVINLKPRTICVQNMFFLQKYFSGGMVGRVYDRYIIWSSVIIFSPIKES
jgi:hypothetical protein